jgi:hypothetical protein
MLKQVRWLRVLLAAFLVEVGLGVTALPFLAVFSGQVVFQIIVPAACLVVPFVLFVIVNLLRIVSAAAGGYAAERRAPAPAA